MKQYNDFKMFSKEQAYWERNQLVCALSKVFPSWLEEHPFADGTWDEDWRNIVFINMQTKQLSWHIHQDDLPFFSHLKLKDGNSWDGHTSSEKYDRLKSLTIWW